MDRHTQRCAPDILWGRRSKCDVARQTGFFVTVIRGIVNMLMPGASVLGIRVVMAVFVMFRSGFKQCAVVPEPFFRIV